MHVIAVKPIPPRLRNNREVHLDYLKHLKESVATLREIVDEAKVVQIVLWYLDTGCSKHMTGDRSRLRNFVKEFIGTVRFGNDHFGAIMGTRSFIFYAWIDKFKARTKFGSYSTLCTPANKDLEILFQPMFDEYLEPPRVDRPVSPAPAVPGPVNSVGTPSTTTIDQHAPSLSHSPSSSALQSPCLHQGVTAESSLMDENLFAPVDNDPS
nr:integrase, catalytic region, zinc finger, CCHC-type, peptidase aspartic, catalytic [Tanacetum cinerariifolium]